MSARLQRMFTSDEFDPWQLLEFYDFYTEERLAEQKSLARKWGATAWELSILEAIWFGYGTVSRSELGQRCHGVYQRQFPDDSRCGVDRCFEKGWVQVITPEFTQEMRDELEFEGYLIAGGIFDKTMSDSECIGLVHFTRPGLELMVEWYGEVPPSDNVDLWSSVREPESVWTVYANTLNSLYKSFEEYQQPFELIEAPRPIGRWCCRWWNRLEHGVVARIRTTEFD